MHTMKIIAGNPWLLICARFAAGVGSSLLLLLLLLLVLLLLLFLLPMLLLLLLLVITNVPSFSTRPQCHFSLFMKAYLA